MTHDEGCSLHYNPEAGKDCDCTVFVPIELARRLCGALKLEGTKNRLHTPNRMAAEHLLRLADELSKLLPR